MAATAAAAAAAAAAVKIVSCRPRPGPEVREVGIPAERVRVEPAVPRPRGEAGERQAEAEPGPQDRLAPVGLSLSRAPVAPAVAPGRYGGRLVDLLDAAPPVLGPRESRGGGIVISSFEVSSEHYLFNVHRTTKKVGDCGRIVNHGERSFLLVLLVVVGCDGGGGREKRFHCLT